MFHLIDIYLCIRLVNINSWAKCTIHYQQWGGGGVKMLFFDWPLTIMVSGMFLLVIKIDSGTDINSKVDYIASNCSKILLLLRVVEIWLGWILTFYMGLWGVTIFIIVFYHIISFYQLTLKTLNINLIYGLYLVIFELNQKMWFLPTWSWVSLQMGKIFHF